MIFLYCSYYYLWHIDLYCVIYTLKMELDFKSLTLFLIQKQTHRTPWRQKLLSCSCIIKNHSAPHQYSQQRPSQHLKWAIRTKSKSSWSHTAPVHQFKPPYVLVRVIILPHLVLCQKRSQAEQLTQQRIQWKILNKSIRQQVMLTHMGA